jgi:hypothetical protein
MRAELVTGALAAAEHTRGSLAGAVLHTDHGAQLAFNERPRNSGKTAWEISWDSVAVIPLNVA